MPELCVFAFRAPLQGSYKALNKSIFVDYLSSGDHSESVVEVTYSIEARCHSTGRQGKKSSISSRTLGLEVRSGRGKGKLIPQ